jgi:DNA-binding MarR family transcriptional regulator
MRLTISRNKFTQDGARLSATSGAAADGGARGGNTAFLVGRLGSEAARRFAERLKPLGLTPPHAGVLRLLMRSPEANQRELAAVLGVHPPRLVVILDEMAKLGLITRSDSEEDRRSNAVVLTVKGRQAFAAVSEVGREHSAELFAGLNAKEREHLVELLHKLAANLGFSSMTTPNSARTADAATRKSKSVPSAKARG